MIFLSRITVIGHSMEPTLLFNQEVLVSGLPYIFRKPKAGDIVLIKEKERKNFIKRIVRIKDNKYFVAGDNKKDSLDSRTFGWITRRQILGKMIFVL